MELQEKKEEKDEKIIRKLFRKLKDKSFLFPFSFFVALEVEVLMTGVFIVLSNIYDGTSWQIGSGFSKKLHRRCLTGS